MFIISLKQNSRKTSKRPSLSEESRQKLKSWLAADYHLYNHFVKRLQEKMLRFGRKRLAAEVAELRKLNMDMAERCEVLEEVDDTGNLSKIFRPWSEDVVGFQVSPEEDCQHFAMTEVFIFISLQLSLIFTDSRFLLLTS